MLRLDIQGLRAVAVMSVVVYHLWSGALPGGFVGVDIFFVISGFLITSHLLHTSPRSGRDLASFWGRRVRRLLPASLLVLLGTLVAMLLVAPETQWASTARQVVASALYVENWQLATESVDYLRAGDLPTPVQHFWSLSVEEQFYLVWPVLILLVAALARLLRRHVTRVIAVAMAVTTLVSLLVSVWLTEHDPAVAYFSTPVRIWELAAGGLLAAMATMSSGRRSGGRLWWSLMAMGGLGAIGLAAWTFSVQTPFPSWRAVLPVGGCVAVIAAGTFHGRTGVSKLLERQPLPFIGDISYSIYLWHWPLIVLVPYVSGGRLGPLDQAAILVVTLVLAVLTKRFVEDPFRRPGRSWIRRGPFRLAAVGMAVVLVAGVGVLHEVQSRREDALSTLAAAVDAADGCFGAAALALGPQLCPSKPNLRPVPFPAQAKVDRTVAYADNCWEYPPFAGTRTCVYGNPDAKVSIALVGNSHAGHWLSTLQELMGAYDVKITTYLASGCNITTARMRWEPRSDGTGCLEWAERVVRETTTHDFDLVVTSAIQTRVPDAAASKEEGRVLAQAGHRDMLERWASAGVDVLVLRDTPHVPSKIGPIPDCVATHEHDVSQCSGPREQWLQADPLADAAAAMNSPAVTTVDLTDRFCDARTCYGVAGGVVVFYDANHMTQTYANTLAPYLAEPLGAAIKRAVGDA